MRVCAVNVFLCDLNDLFTLHPLLLLLSLNVLHDVLANYLFIYTLGLMVSAACRFSFDLCAGFHLLEEGGGCCCRHYCSFLLILCSVCAGLFLFFLLFLLFLLFPFSPLLSAFHHSLVLRCVTNRPTSSLPSVVRKMFALLSSSRLTDRIHSIFRIIKPGTWEETQNHTRMTSGVQCSCPI